MLTDADARWGERGGCVRAADGRGRRARRTKGHGKKEGAKEKERKKEREEKRGARKREGGNKHT